MSGLLHTLAGIFAGLIIAIWERHNAKRDMHRLERQIADLRDRLPEQVGGIVTKLASSVAQAVGHVEGGVAGAVVTLADINGDGHRELLVDFPGGAHGSVLEVYGFRGLDFQHLGGISSGTPSGFEVADFDGDGRPEVASTETDWESGKCYAEAPRLRAIHKWIDGEFRIIRQEPYVADENT